jgi:S-layer family protein
VIAARTAPAESPDAAGDPQDTYGTTALTAHDVASWGFTPLSDGQWSHFLGTGWSNRTGGTNNATCTNINLPSGALLSAITTYTNDTDATVGADITYSLFVNNIGAGTQSTQFSFISTGAPGVQRVLRPVAPVVQINNNQNAYVLCVQHGSASGTNQNAGATLWYRLQVTPAPATATFTDVPVGHGQHRFVEALVAAGITGGCGGGLYCPDSPVTRGQMAVFLAVTLGLHFPN